MADEPAQQLSELRRSEAQVERRSAVFKKELGLMDLALTQVLFIVGLPWIGVAAKQGPSHVVLWLLAMLFFYVPSAVVVIYLNRLMPLEGGLYQWAKLGFNEMIGFMVAWNLWLFAILNTSEIGLQITQYVRYVIGPEGEWLTANKWFIGAVSSAIIALLVWLATVGLGVGKWVHKAGGVLMIATFAAVLVLPLISHGGGASTESHALRIEMPALSLMSFNLLGKMGFGALGGFEYVAIHAGECRDPVRAISRSVMLAAPIIAVMFILGTNSVLTLIPQDRIDLIAPIPQVLSEGFRSLSFAAAIVPAALLAMLCIRVAQSSVMFTGNTRLPMVAGWDRLLPEWFTRLHARYRTPVNSILFVGAATLTMGMLGLIGVGKQEAFQLLWNASGVFYALTYLAMFALPLVGLRNSGAPRPIWLTVSAWSGGLMTLLYIALSIVPIIEVESRLSFAVKIIGLIALTNIVGLLIFIAAGRGRRARAALEILSPDR
jgi:glutamate:GABA antiporter